VDLIRRQQGPVRIPSAEETETVQFMDALLGPTAAEPGEPVERPRGWLARGAKLAGLAFGSIVLCGSVYAAATLTQHRPQAAADNDGAVLTGVGALLPDSVEAQLSQGAIAVPTTAGTPRAPAITARPAGPVRSGRARVTTSSPVPVAPTQGLLNPADVVRSFYQLVGTDPTLAVQFLAPSLLHGDRHGFYDAWQGLSDVRIESVRQMSAHTAQAVILLEEPDGTWLRVVELLQVTGGGAPLISGAELLSAQHG
jgi:hypothetical protein